MIAASMWSTMRKATQRVMAAAAATKGVALHWLRRAFTLRAESGLGEFGALADDLGKRHLLACSDHACSALVTHAFASMLPPLPKRSVDRCNMNRTPSDFLTAEM